MPFTASYTVAQSLDCKTLTITDTSTYNVEGKNTFSDRRITIYKNDGTTIVPAGVTATYIDLNNYPSNSFQITIDEDFVLQILMQLTSLSPTINSVYTANDTFGFTCYLDSFKYELLEDVAANQKTLDGRFMNSLGELQTELDNVKTAVTYKDINAAQQAINRANEYKNNENKYF